MLSGREKAAKLGEKPEKRCFQDQGKRLNREKSLKKILSDPGMAAKLEKSPEKDVFSPGKSG